MKKFFALNFLSIFLFLVSMGQKNKTEYGISGGLNVNSAYGESVSKDFKSTLVGFSAGGSIKYNTSKHFGIKALLQYDQNGWAYRSLTLATNTGNLLGKGDILFKLNYLTLPLLAEYSFGNKIKFKTGAGIFLGLLLSNQVITKVKEPYAPNNTPTTKSRSDYRRSANFGLSFGAGLQIPVSSAVKFDLGLRNNLGLANIYKGDATIKTNSFSIQTGFTFSK